MMVFGVAALLMVAVALVLVIPPIAMARGQRGPSRADVQRALYREKLVELEAQRDSGSLDEESFEQACRELDRDFLSDAAPASDDAPPAPQAHPYRAAIVAVLIPIVAAGVYLATGTPAVLVDDALLSPAAGTATAGGNVPDVASMVASLEQRLQREPGDAEGWVMLARSYQVMRRPEDARRVLEQALTHHPSNPMMLVQLAETTATLNGNRLDGRPIELVNRALELAPDYARALWLAGIHALNQGDAAGAVTRWERVLEVAELEPAARSQIEEAIAGARQRAGAPAPASIERPDAASSSIEVTVTLADALAGRVSSGDSLYVFARAAQGPPMPLAVRRLSAAEIPVTVTLDDSLAMAPGLALSQFDAVVVTARISRDGTPGAKPGDLQGASDTLSPADGAKVTVVIDRLLE